MKLRTQQGELDLPLDFSMTMERTNPLLSDEGDSSIPATLPASSNNLAVLGHRERIDRSERYDNKVEAMLEIGPVQKRGQLIIDTVQRQAGIDASFAIDNSDLYVKSKEKSLKDIIDMGRNGLGIKIPFSDVDNACQYMIKVYNGSLNNTDFVVFPVAIAAYEEGENDDKHTVYQYNNEAGGQYGLVYEERFVREGDVNMLVPKGYGIAPFLKLQRMIDVLFACLGYTVVENCFNEEPFYSQIAVVHNCSDCLVRPLLDYKDLVPSCTLSEFLDWLLAKFHVQPVVDSESKEVRIVKMDAVLNTLVGVGGFDMDISGLVEGDWKVQIDPSKRVVLTPTIKIEGTEPAAETFDKLLEKYGQYVECTEAQFRTLESDNPAFTDCLLLRKATGVFYILERSLSTGKMEMHELGTNYFTYDRNNSEETESFSQADVMPLMLCGPKCETAPYIGDRIHKHTSYNGDADDSEQDIIVVQAHTGQNFAYRTTGTTQKSIPHANGYLHYDFWFGMDNYSLFRKFWQNYNKLILNNPMRLTGQLKLDIAQFLGMDMSTLKLCDGQRLLPVSASARIGSKMGITEAEFVRAEYYLDGESDSSLSPVPASPLKWRMTSESDAVTSANIYLEHIYSSTITWRGFEVEHNGVPEPIWIGVPSALGEIRQITALAKFTIKTRERIDTNYNGPIVTRWVNREWRVDGHYDENGRCLDPGPFDWLQLTKTYIFEAVPA